MLESFHDVRILKLESAHLPVYLYTLNGMLVDTGFARRRRDFLQFLRESKLREAIITHHHEDHSGNVATALEAGLEVWAPRLAIDPIARGFPVQLYRWRVWGYPEHGRCRELGSEMRAGTLDVSVVPAPGHSEDMVVLHVPERGWLFAGDLFISRKLRFLRDDEDPNALIASLDRALALDFETLFCAHRGVIQDGRAQLQAKRDHLTGLRDRVRELAARGLNHREITRTVFGREGPMYYYTLGRFSAINFVKRFLGK